MTVLTVTGFLLILSGLLGCVFPFIPGLPLSYLALILLSFEYKWEPFSTPFLILMGVIVLTVTALDFIVPKRTVKKYGASRPGVLGSLIGMILGNIIFPPYGLVFGSFIGAISGELISSKNEKSALKAGAGVFTGTILGIMLRNCIVGLMAYYSVKTVIAYSL